MARKKDQQQSGDGKYRKETKEERKIRLKQQSDARDACFKVIPQVLGGVCILLVVFALYVRSVPPAPRPVLNAAAAPPDTGPPDFMGVNTEDAGGKTGADLAAEMAKNIKENTEGTSETQGEETIEL